MAKSDDRATLEARIESLEVENNRLREQRARVIQALDLAPIYFYLLDEEGRTLMLNQQFAKFYGREIRDLIGQPLPGVHPNAEESARMMRNIRETIAHGEPKILRDQVYTDHEGNSHIADTHDIPFVDAASGEKRLLGIGIDITERRELEKRKLSQLRIEHDLMIARDIQRSLLPDAPPPLDSFDLAGWSEAADETGGDYFDWMPLPDGRVVASIADVSGHGVGSAIVTAVCRAYARAMFRGEVPLEALVERLNNLMCDDLPQGRFVTFAVMNIDPVARHAELLSAGHGPILVYRAATDRVEASIADGVPLGVMRDEMFGGVRQIKFDPGDALVLISDGFFEWPNAAGEQFGLDRLNQAVADAVRPRPGLTSADAIDHLREKVYTHVGDVKQVDDMTAVVVRRHRD